MFPRYLTRFDPAYVRNATRNVPYQRLDTGLFPGVDVWMRRDDLIDPLISGNKAYKLVYNLHRARTRGIDTLITCGGAWSNHIHATAAAGCRFGFRTVGIIRGHRPDKLSSTLQDAERYGMELKFVSRALYRDRHSDDFLDKIGLGKLEAHFIPEGGGNCDGLQGAKMLGEAIRETAPVAFDQVWLACGTGTSLAGIQAGLGDKSLTGVPVLKAEHGIAAEARRWLASIGCQRTPEIIKGYHGGGYARQTSTLKEFQHRFEADTGVPLEPVYTAKLAHALSRRIQAGAVPPGSRILLIHSGGLQGRRGF